MISYVRLHFRGHDVYIDSAIGKVASITWPKAEPAHGDVVLPAAQEDWPDGLMAATRAAVAKWVDRKAAGS